MSGTDRGPTFSAFPYIGSKTYLAPWVVERSYNRSAGKDNLDRTERLYLSYDPEETPRFVDGQQQTLFTATDGGNSRSGHTATDQEDDR